MKLKQTADALFDGAISGLGVAVVLIVGSISLIILAVVLRSFAK